jgi:hypothetical protein
VVQICAANAACTSAACSNIFDTALTNVFIDCVSLCNANMTVMSPYANKTCVEVRRAEFFFAWVHGLCSLVFTITMNDDILGLSHGYLVFVSLDPFKSGIVAGDF